MNTTEKALAATLALLLAPGASAEVRVCNEFAQPVFVAIGWVENADVITQGWWPVATGQCRTVDRRALRTPHYYYIETNWTSNGRGGKVLHSWGQGRTLAVGTTDEFRFFQAQNIAANDVRVQFGDLSGRVEGAKSVTIVIKADGVQTEKQYRSAD